MRRTEPVHRPRGTWVHVSAFRLALPRFTNTYEPKEDEIISVPGPLEQKSTMCRWAVVSYPIATGPGPQAHMWTARESANSETNAR